MYVFFGFVVSLSSVNKYLKQNISQFYMYCMLHVSFLNVVGTCRNHNAAFYLAYSNNGLLYNYKMVLVLFLNLCSYNIFRTGTVWIELLCFRTSNNRCRNHNECVATITYYKFRLFSNIVLTKCQKQFLYVQCDQYLLNRF